MTEQRTPYIVSSNDHDDIRATFHLLADALIRTIDTAFGEIAGLRADIEALHQAPARQQWLDRREAAEYLRCSPSTIDDMASSGRLPKYRLGPQTPLYRVEDLDALVVPVATDKAA